VFALPQNLKIAYTNNNNKYINIPYINIKKKNYVKSKRWCAQLHIETWSGYAEVGDCSE
jgi:hypothetical protein